MSAKKGHALAKAVVAKFGGSSLADASKFEMVRQIIRDGPARRIVVPSAPGKRQPDDHKVTDLLYMCHQLAEHNIEFSDVFSLVTQRFEAIHQSLGLTLDLAGELDSIREQIERGASADYVASRGEYLSGRLLAEYLGFTFVDAAEVIRFDATGRYDSSQTMELLGQRLIRDPRVVIPGFYGADAEGEIHTFSRGGSDVTGAIVARAARACLYENWTDVSGFLTADPRIVEDSRPIKVVTYRELRELSYMGAAVLHEEAIFPVRERGIPIHVRNTGAPEDPGTLIVADDREARNFDLEQALVDHRGGDWNGITGIAGMKDFTVIQLDKTLMDDEKGFLRKLVSVLETNGISISHVPTGIDSASVVVRSEDVRFKLEKILAELKIYCHPDSVKVESGISLVTVVGRNMVRSPGVAGRVFSALGDADINVRMISQGAGEMSIIIGVDDREFEKTVRALHSVI